MTTREITQKPIQTTGVYLLTVSQASLHIEHRRTGALVSVIFAQAVSKVAKVNDVGRRIEFVV